MEDNTVAESGDKVDIPPAYTIPSAYPDSYVSDQKTTPFFELHSHPKGRLTDVELEMGQADGVLSTAPGANRSRTARTRLAQATSLLGCVLTIAAVHYASRWFCRVVLGVDI